MKKCLITLLTAAAIATPQAAFAHALETDYQFLELPDSEAIADQPILLTSQYSTGEPLVGAEVMIYAPDNWDEPWQQGKTDNQGQFAFLPDTQMPGNWEVKIRQAGHGDLLTIPVNAEGADLAQVGQGEKQDQHYGELPLGGLWRGAIALVALGTVVGIGRIVGYSGQRSEL